jgi:hypothetical protein
MSASAIPEGPGSIPVAPNLGRWMATAIPFRLSSGWFRTFGRFISRSGFDRQGRP